MDPTDERARVTRDPPPPLDGVRVAVASDLTLLAETLCAALRSRKLQVVFVPWWTDGPGSAPGRTHVAGAGPAVVLLACDLGLRARIDEARERGWGGDVPWVVLTECVRGPAWGAMLEAGARAVVASTISLDGLVEVLWTVSRGESPMGEVERLALLGQWRAAKESQDRLRERMTTLSPREQEVLSMLYEGTTVRAIAERLAISEATVRSQVKGVFRKLAVASQLAAVAAVGELRQDEGRGH
jgi:DNA-binding NarL/FixJ family response regulator